jgi:putative nucleotidyltransferase with HDIG domain
MDKIDYLYKYLPKSEIDWELIQSEIFYPFASRLENTNQEPKWHGEGNVLNHTKMVLDKFISLDEYQELDEKDKLIVFLAALFHDIGKIVCTKNIDGEITSYNHGIVGSVMLREYLWKDLGLAGNERYQQFREAICLLVRYHSTPIHSYDNLEKRIIKLSLNSSLTSDFKLSLLAILAKADALGRIGEEYDEHLFNIELFNYKAKIYNCENEAFKFQDSYTKYQYLVNDNVWAYNQLYDKTFGTIILLCGLPGTGKDTYINNNYPNMPVISLDDIRSEYNISPTENQSRVYEIAKERAKVYLRNKKEFIWNATNLTNLVRNKQLNLFHGYNFKVKIIFLETDLDTNLSRNKSRKRVVDEKVIYKMLSNINMPEAFEAEEVEWKCI